MIKFFLLIFSFRIIFRLLSFALLGFVLYVVYIYFKNDGDIAEIKDIIVGYWLQFTEWIEKALTYHLEEPTIESDHYPASEMFNKKEDQSSSLLIHIKNALC